MIDPQLPPRCVAVDAGGNFTDVFVHDVREGTLRFDKVPTIPSDLTGSVLGAFAKVGADPSKSGYFAHGITLGLNALPTRTGANTAIVTTQGFRDVYLLGRTDRVATYDFKYRKPASLVKRSQIFEVPERINFKGETLKSFDTDAARAVAAAIQAEGIESVAVCFLHSYVNPAQEISMLRVLAEVTPTATVKTASCTLQSRAAGIAQSRC
jgi:N-methylhydantoinase A